MDKEMVLIADDESRMRKLVNVYLKKEGFFGLEAPDGRQALTVFKQHEQNICACILDVMMPELDGWELCREIREISDVPIIMLTARGEEVDEFFSFEQGADDYIKKPFSPKILIVRLKALLKRSRQEEKSYLETGLLKINQTAHKVFIGDAPVDLCPKEYELLLLLIRHESRVLDRMLILRQVWKYEYAGDTRTVDTHIKKLRKKLGPASNYIKTVWGYGYRFEVE